MASGPPPVTIHERAEAKLNSFGPPVHSVNCLAELKEVEEELKRGRSSSLEDMKAASPPRSESLDNDAELFGEDAIELQYRAWQEAHPSALDNFSRLIHSAEGRHVAVFLDYDGTLSPIVEDPDKAFMPDGMRATVREVASHFPTAIISGRGREKVYGFVQLPELFYAGSHGMDIMVPVQSISKGSTRGVLADASRAEKSSVGDGTTANGATGTDHNQGSEASGTGVDSSVAAARSVDAPVDCDRAASDCGPSDPMDVGPSDGAVHPSASPVNNGQGAPPAKIVGPPGTQAPSVGACEVEETSMKMAAVNLQVLGPSTVFQKQEEEEEEAVHREAALPLSLNGTLARDSKGNQVIVFQPAKQFEGIMDKVTAELIVRASPIPGAFVENNKFCISVHFRRVEEERWEALADIVSDVVQQYAELRISHGRKVLEIRPVVDWNKGKALSYLLETLGFGGSSEVLPLYIGDDRTDEDAFKVLNERATGFGIIVSRVCKASVANFSLRDPYEVKAFLEHLVRWKHGEG